MVAWIAFEDGASLGTSGSEGGVILRDEFHPEGARVTLEQGPRIPFSITCGLSGSMVHTVFAGTREEADALFDAVRSGLDHLIAVWPASGASEAEMDRFFEEIGRFVDRF